MALPEVSYYTVPEVAERWGQSSDYVLRLADDGLLRLCARSKPYGRHRHWFVDMIPWSEEREPVDFSVPEPVPRCRMHLPSFHPLRQDTVRELLETGTAMLWRTAPEQGRYFRIVVSALGGELPPTLTLQELFILRNELEDFELRHGLGSQDDEAARARAKPYLAYTPEVLAEDKAWVPLPLQLALEAWDLYWRDYDPERLPKNSEIYEWLNESGKAVGVVYSSKQLEAIASLIRPESAPNRSVAPPRRKSRNTLK